MQADPNSWQRRCVQADYGAVGALPLVALCERLAQDFDLDLALATNPTEWKSHVKSKLVAAVERDWKASMGNYPRLKLYAQYKTDLCPPGFSTLPRFRGRDKLIKARINDLYLRLTHPEDNCVCCGASLPAVGRGDDETGMMVHFFLECPSTRPLLAALRARADWLPHDWDTMRPRAKLAFLLLLPDNGQPPCAARDVGAFLDVVLQNILDARQPADNAANDGPDSDEDF